MENLSAKITQLTDTLLTIVKIVGGEAQAQDFPQLADYEGLKRNIKFIQQREHLIEFYRQTFQPSPKSLTINQLIVQHIILAEIFQSFSFWKQNLIAQLLQELSDTFLTKKHKIRLFSDLQVDLAEWTQSLKTTNFSLADWEKLKTTLLPNFIPKNPKNNAKRILPTIVWQSMIEFLKEKIKTNSEKTLADQSILLAELDEFVLQLIDYQTINENSKFIFSQLPDYYWLAYHQQKNRKKGDIIFAQAFQLFSANQSQSSLFALPNPYLKQVEGINQKKYSIIYFNTFKYNNKIFPPPNFWLNRTRVSYNPPTEELENLSVWRWASDQVSDTGALLAVSDAQWLRNPQLRDFRQKLNEEFKHIIIFELPDNQTISLLFKQNLAEAKDSPQIQYLAVPNEEFWFKNNAQGFDFQQISPYNGDWLEQMANDFAELLPLLDNDVKMGKSKKAIFKWFENYNNADNQVVNSNQLLQLAEKTSNNSQIYLANYLQNSHFFVWAGEGQPDYKFLKKTLVLPYFRQAGDGQTVENITNWGLNQFRKHYETPWQAQAQSNIYYLKKLFDFSEFEQCQVDESLAFEIRRLTLLADNPLEINQLFKTINQPEAKTEEIFQKFNKLFREVNRTYTRLGSRAGKNAESREILQRYFIAAEEASGALASYLENQLDEQTFGHSLTAQISKKDVFHYVYAVLQSPNYQEKYAEFLKHNAPRVPFYPNFWQWVAWGEKLFAWHAQLEKVKAFSLNIIEQIEDGVGEKWLWKIEENNRQILLTNQLTIQKLPQELWDLQVQNRPLFEWFWENFKAETKAKPLIDSELLTHKQQWIDLLAKITFVAQETARIRQDMKRQWLIL
jgi:hypothetical protein